MQKKSIMASISHMFPPNKKFELFDEEVQQKEHEAGHLHPSKAEAENAWSFTSI
jgi:hypothetical protein